jgi:PilZ domain-containing protein
MAQSEKRAEKRIQYEHTITFRTENTIMEISLDISNISMSGVYVVTSQPLDIATKCSIEIKLTDEENERVLVLVEGIVSRVDDKGQGVQFTSLTEDNIAMLQQIVSSGTQQARA